MANARRVCHFHSIAAMPRSMSVAELEELGRQYCKQKNYPKAIQAFSEAFDATAPPDISYLDLRAAVHEKLEDFTAALKDGKQMIRLARQDARGYLRTGRVLQKMEGKAQTALDIYNLGLRSVKAEDKAGNLRLLQAMRDKLTRQLSPPKSIDPLTVLPAELVDLIMEYLSFHQQVNCLRVSKNWNSFLESQPRLWAELDLSMAQKPVHPAFVRKCMYRSKMKIRVARVNRLRDETMVLKLTRACKELDTLEFLGSELSGASILEPLKLCSKLQTLRLGKSSVITLDAVTQILRHTPTLVCAEFGNVESRGTQADWKVDLPNLRRLKLGAGSIQVMGSLALNLYNLCLRAPSLTSLSLHDWKLHGAFTQFDFSSLSSLDTLHLVNTPYTFFPGIPSSLRNLTLTGRSVAIPPRELEAISKKELPLLETFEYIDPPISSESLSVHDLLERLLCWDEHGMVLDRSKLTMLKKFSLSPCIRAHSGSAGAILSNWRLWQVEELKMDQTEFTSEESFAERLVENFTHLTALSLPRSRITGVGIKRIITGLRAKHAEDPARCPGQLRRLNLDYCLDVSPDAVEWAKKQGVEVSWKTYTVKPSGKKVRY